MKKIIPQLFILLSISVLSACSSFGPGISNLPKPTPLKPFTIKGHMDQLWMSTNGYGNASEKLALEPTLVGNLIYTTSGDGTITAHNIRTGALYMTIHTNQALSTGITAVNGLLLVSTKQSQLLAICQNTGLKKWEATLPAVSLTAPAISGTTAIVKTQDGQVLALNLENGQTLWTYAEPNNPPVVLRNASAPVIDKDTVYAGFADGSLAQLSLQTGKATSFLPLTLPSLLDPDQNLTDVAATPVLINSTLIAGTFGGKLYGIDTKNFNVLWQTPNTLSVDKPMVADTDSNALYVGDSNGLIYYMDPLTGLPNWTQTDLQYRRLSGLAYSNQDNGILVVGDDEGFVHVLSAQDGAFISRAFTNQSGISATPVITDGEIFVYTNNDQLYAYKLTK